MPIPRSMRPDTKLYDLLDVSPDASAPQIAKAYKIAAMKYHPDRNPDAPPEKFKEISAAYDVLKDEQKREVYDQYGLEGLKEGMGGAGASNMSSLFDLLTGHSSSSARHGDGSSKGEPHVIPLKVTLETLYNGETVQIPIDRKIICQPCKGTGGKKRVHCRSCHGQGVRMGMTRMGPLVFQQPIECRDCGGQGEIILPKDRCNTCLGKKVINDRKLLDVTILPGFVHGKKIKFSGEHDQLPDKEPGDVFVVLEQEKHPVFERINGDDLLIKMKINLSESLTGFQRLITHLDGRQVRIQHPADQPIAPGTFKRVTKQGMVSMETHHTGDLVIHFDVEFPPANFFKDLNLIKTLETLLPSKSTLTMPPGSNIDEATDMVECEQQPRSTATSNGHHHKKNNDDDDDDYMDEDDDDDDDGHPGVHACHTQ